MQLLKKLLAAVLAAVILKGPFFSFSLVSAADTTTDLPYTYNFDNYQHILDFSLKKYGYDPENTFYFSYFLNDTNRLFTLVFEKNKTGYPVPNISFSKDSLDLDFVYGADQIITNLDLGWSGFYQTNRFILTLTSSYLRDNPLNGYVNTRFLGSDIKGYQTNIWSKTYQKDPSALYGVRLGVDKDSFTQWIINNKKIDEIKAYWKGATVGNIDKIVDWWSQYNHSPALAFIHLPELFSYFSDIGYTVDDVADLYALLKSYYFEFQSYLVTDQAEAIVPSNVPNMHHRQENPDLSLVTDQDDDSTVISLLREILRVLINLPKDISTFFNYLPVRIDIIISQLNSLIDFNNTFPDLLSAKIHSAFSSDIDDLIAAIGSSSGSVDVSNNISVDNFIDVTVPDQKQKEINEFFTDWNITFSDKINSKFPAAAQLGDIFNDQFFEKCGIDVNGDGEVFEYYSADAVLSPETSLTSPEGKLLTQFIDQFDNADPSYLDNVSFSEDVPDLTVSISGQKCSIFDFRIYARYRTEIHGILTFILFITYFLSLYKSFPSIIGRVSDVVHSFRTDKEV